MVHQKNRVPSPRPRVQYKTRDHASEPDAVEGKTGVRTTAVSTGLFWQTAGRE